MSITEQGQKITVILYPHAVNPAYISHAADNVMILIARVQVLHEYNPDCTMIETDLSKEQSGSKSEEQDLFRQ